MATSFKRRTPYGGLLEHHLRIGDTEFYVPPTAISVHRQFKNERLQILRARNSMTRESGYFDRVIDITLFFPDMDTINLELRPLLAQAKKCPFLPIENTYLNDIHKLDAVTIAGVTVQTTPGFPHTLQCQLQLYAFEPYAYIADSEERTFDEMFDWPLFRWYYSRNLDEEQAGSGQFTTFYEPLYEDLDNSFKFRIVDSEQLQAISDYKKERRKLIKEYIDAKRENFWGNEGREEKFNEKYMELNSKAMFEYNLDYEDWDIPGLVLTDFSVGFENSITSMQLQHDESPTHQYMGSQDTILMARFTADDEAVASLESLVRRSTYLIRDFHKEVANGFIEFDHQLARLFGVKNVTFEDMQVNTIDGLPGMYNVTLTMIAYNRMHRKMNEVQWMTETAEWNISEWEDQGFWSVLTAANPFTWASGETFTDTIFLDNPLARWTRFLADRPASEAMWNAFKIHAEGEMRTATGEYLPEDAIKQIIYDEAAKEFILKHSEVYPDLELPTYQDCRDAGFDVPNTNNGIFVDPDFFIKYNTGTMFWEDVQKAMNGNFDISLRDGTGGEATLSANGAFTNVNETTKKQQEQARTDYEAAAQKNGGDTSEISKEFVDNSNLSKSDMEALIREKAQLYKINQNLPLAFARAMDEELKQFFNTGVNAKQGKVVGTAQTVSGVSTIPPVQMNENFKFFTTSDESLSGEYIGVMKVQPAYSGNVNMLGYNTEYNVETGVRKMSEFYAQLTSSFAMKDQNGKNVYSEKNVFETFGLNQNKSFDKEKARFVGVIMLYLGFEKEYFDLLKNNKQPPKKLADLIREVIAEATNDKQWTAAEIKKKTDKLPIKDFKSDAAQPKQATAAATTLGDQSVNVEKGMLHDMIRYDKRGRLVRAFPTFFMLLIDEGQYVSTIKLSDQYFNYQAVMDIMHVNNRKEASSTLMIEMANIYGTLDDAEKGMDLTNTTFRDVFKTLTMPGAVAKDVERSRHRNPNYYKSIMLRTGTRIHFRMGYGSNPMEMPTIMNGTITSIQNNGESLSVIAQDDGIELTNKIRADVNETTDGGFWTNKQEPTEIVDEILTDSQGFFKNLWAGLSNDEFNHHSLGIMHFGHQQSPQGWGEFKSFFGGFVNGALVGGTAGTALGPVGAAIGAIGGGLTAGIFNSATFGKESRKIQEINMNIYQTTGLTNEEQDQWWNRVKDAFGIGKSDETGINISLYDKSVWDVLNICASIGDDHVVAVHPFGFRNTIFSGKTWYNLHYDYIVDGKTVVGTASKPFRQVHVYDSVSSILDNSIITTEENMKTVAVGVYMNEGEMDTTSPVYVDTNIWPEKQRVVNIDTTMNAQGIRMLENPVANIPGINLVTSALNKPFKWYFDEGVALKITARGLSDYVRDMYDGYLTVVGDPSVKPYDQMMINDTHNSISGPADVKEVTQIMNHQVGYITMIKPDAVVVNSDRRSLTLGMSALNIAGTAATTWGLRKIFSTAKYQGHLPIMNAMWSLTRNSFDRMRGKFDAGKMKTANLRDKLTGKLPKNLQKIKFDAESRKKIGVKAKDWARWGHNGMLDQLEKVIGTDARNNLDAIMKNGKNFGINTVQNLKTAKLGSKLMASGTRKLKPILGGMGGLLRSMWIGGHAVAGPIGWIAAGIEALVMHILTSTIGEMIDRWLFQRQAVIISPLTKSGLEYTAGINGHKGSVMGDSPDGWQKVLANDFSALVLGFFAGADTSQFSQDSREGLVQAKGIDDITSNLQAMASNMVEQFRKPTQTIAKLDKLYDDDRKAALAQTNKRLEILASRETKAVHDEEKTSWDDWKSKIGDWFNGLWEKVKSLFSSSSGGGTCTPKGDVPLNGKAKGLSKYFDVIGPKIETEAKKQGIGDMAEIIKAKVMQESGGNYVKYPDVMQASESLGKPIGYIKDVDQSITQGVKYFKEKLSKANGDIKLALQSYNYGGGFIDYVMKRGGKYTKELAWEFAEYMVKKLGKKISRIEPGYGDSSYVAHVLRYYDGNLPDVECEEGSGGTVTGGASSCPSVVGSEGKKKYRTSTGSELVDLAKESGPWGITVVGGTSKVRPGTKEALAAALKGYGKKANVTSGWRPGDPNWHGTGWAVDLDTPNTMKMSGGKLRFPNGSDKDNARKLCEACIQAGFRALYFGDWDIVQEMNKKYGAGTMNYDPSGHYNHLHCSYPICKK